LRIQSKWCYFAFATKKVITMSKSTNFTGQPVLSQLLKFIDKQKINELSKKMGSERYIKSLDGYTHLVIMLFGVLRHADSLREITALMQAEAPKLHHLGIDYIARRSTLAEANKRRPQEFFSKVYSMLLKKYGGFLADSRTEKGRKAWESQLYMMDSTTISLFDNILKGVGRHPKNGKKKGGLKVHTVMRYSVGVPMVVRLTSAATHDHWLLKEVHLPKDSTIAMDRAYIDYAQFQRLTDEGVCYVTKMKRNLTYKVLGSTIFVDPQGLVTHTDQHIVFEKGALRHESRKVEIWSKDRSKPVTLLTNNFDLSVEDIEEIYKRRWAIESLYKQLKQNFPLHFFYGDSVNAIEVQTWVVLIANLLCTIMQHMIKRHCSFSNLATMIRIMLMYYVDLQRFMENPEKDWEKILQNATREPPPEEPTFDFNIG
jgi:hypothetical protein